MKIVLVNFQTFKMYFIVKFSCFFSRIHNSKYICRQQTNIIFICPDITDWWGKLTHHFHSPTPESQSYFSQMLQTLLQPDQTLTKRRCSLSSKFGEKLACLHSNDIVIQEHYCNVSVIGYCSTITGLLVLGEEKLVAVKTIIGLGIKQQCSL